MPPAKPPADARQLAFQTLREVYQGAFADVALERTLARATLADADRRLLTELVYGIVRRQRTLDALIDQLGKKPAHAQPRDVRVLLHLGLYQLRYLDHIPDAAAVHTTVALAERVGLRGLKSFINGLLRQYQRLAAAGDPLRLPSDPVTRLGVQHSYPDWIVETWLRQLGEEEAEQLCRWLNQPPPLDLRVNPLRAEREEVLAAMQEAGLAVAPVPHLPQALRVTGSSGPIQALPGFTEGAWSVQDSSAQLVSHLLSPQPGQVVIDACAAPGGKSTHLAELMGDQGTVWACDRTASRLRRLEANAERLNLHNIRLREGDSRAAPEFRQQADHVLLDAPCSGLGTLHRHADARWRQTPESVHELATLQGELLDEAVTWLKPGGSLVYATCTLHPSENEETLRAFLARHPRWHIAPPSSDSPTAPFATPDGWLKVWPHRAEMDGFFMVKLRNSDL